MKDAVLNYIQGVKQADSPADVLKQVYHIPVLAALIAFMLAVRLRKLENFQTDGGVLFRGNDPWYHFRQTNYLIENFPTVMPFDPMTNYPTGTSVDQFGTLYDQIVSGFILLTSFGNPSTEYAGLIMLIAAPVFMTATVVLVYLIAARFTGRWPALLGAAVFALLPGSVLTYSLVGFYDHQGAEVFFQTFGVLGFVTAIAVAQQSQPVWELVVDRDLDALRRPLLYSIAAGIAAALYMWAWPPGVFLIGFTGVFFALRITTDVYHNRSPEPIAFVGAVSMTVTGILMLLPVEPNNFTVGIPVQHSLLQVIIPLIVGFGSVFLAYLARQWEARGLDQSLYPVVAGSLILASVVGFNTFVQGIYTRFLNVVGFSATAGARTIGEATPPLAENPAFEFIYSQYRLTLFTAIAAVLLILARPLVKSDNTRDTGYVIAALAMIGLIYLGTPVIKAIAGLFGLDWQVVALLISTGLIVGATLRHRYDATELYVTVWGGFIVSAAFTQVRFNYYLAVVVAVFNALFIAQAANLINIRETTESIEESVQSLEGWQIMAGVTIIFLVIAPFVFPTVAAWETGGRNAPGAVQVWDDSLDWMNENTPAPGRLERPDGEAMNPTGTYESPSNGDFDYPEGAYGVLSWWDYGHWITVLGERIPNANPFQDGTTAAAQYLLAPNETAAQSALNRKMGKEGQTRYIMIDSQMVNPNRKFSAPTVFNDDVSFSEYIDVVYRSVGGQFQPVRLRTQQYYESQMIRLYAYHGSAVKPTPVVFDSQRRTFQTRDGGQTTIRTVGQGYQTFATLERAKSYVAENPGAILGGIGSLPRERVDALEHYRLIKSSQSTSGRYIRDVRRTQQLTNASSFGVFRNAPSWVKTFEKVPGATVEGSGAPPGTEVKATVEMRIPSNGRTFRYTQYATADENGDFEMTLPYSTTGYENFGPENGYTNVSVRAVSDYRFRTTSDTGPLFTGSATVTEAQVVGVDDDPVRVQLTETQPVQASRQSIQVGG